MNILVYGVISYSFNPLPYWSINPSLSYVGIDCECVAWGRCDHLLDSIGEDDESYEDSNSAIQEPDAVIVSEDLSTDEYGKSHDPPDKGVKSCE